MTETFISTGSVCLLLGIYLSTFYTYEQYKRFSLSQFNIDNDSITHKAHLTVCYSRMIQRKQNAY